MKTHVEGQRKSQNQASIQKKENGSQASSKIEDNRPETAVMSKLQAMANGSTSPPIQKNDNNTGLPDQLKSGVEALSGQSMDDVSVHYNSNKPSELNAHAYAQGTDIHVAPGQEKHLPHEAWHVVQQKQGRVQPTAQLKGKVSINDDSSLEKEADVMGVRASNWPVRQKAELSKKTDAKKPAVQLQITQRAEDELVEKFDSLNEKSEKEVDPTSEKHKTKLEALKKGGSNMGEGEKIELQGELTFGAKFNRFIGKESTYSQFLRKAEEFNKSTDVAEKQSLLKELKPLARTWLERHAIAEASGDKQDENEKLKRVSIYKFLNQTTSNYPELMGYYEDLKKSMNSFLAGPVENRAEFHQAVVKYQSIRDALDGYKSSFPPSLNLLYFTELEDFDKADKEIKKNGEQKGIDFDTGLGFSATDTKATYDLLTGKISFAGELAFNSPDFTSADGEVNLIMNSDLTFNNITIKGGNCELNLAGLLVKLEDLDYNFQERTFRAKKSFSSLTILDHKISVNVKEAVIANGTFDFEEISGEFPDTNFGFISLKKSALLYNKENNKVSAKTAFAIENAATLGLTDLSSSGDVDIAWTKNEGVTLTLTDGALAFKLYNQAATATKIKIDSKKRSLNIGDLNLNLDFGEQFKRTFTGKGVEFSDKGFDFSELGMNSEGEQIDLKVLKLKPSKYSILKVDSAGYKLQADGSVELTLPEVLGVNAEGGLSGNISFNFKNKKGDYHLKDGGAEVKVPNPLYKLGSLIGSDGGVSTDFELGGAIPVFPAVSATFGVFLKFAASFGEHITAKIGYDKHKDAISFNIGTTISANVGAGAFIGFKGGYDVLISIQARLEAGGNINVTGNFGYNTSFPLNKNPKSIDKIDKTKEGVNYDMNGTITLEAALALIASALYFFKKDFRITLGKHELGSFTLDKENGFELNPTKKDLASEEDLKKEADPEYKEEVAGMSAQELLEKDYTYRFTRGEKSDAVSVFTKDEQDRKNKFKEDQGEGERLFYPVPIENMKRFNHFINNRFNWAGINEIFKMKVLPSKELLKESPSQRDEVLKTLSALGDNVNIAQAFVNHYKSPLLDKLEEKKGLYDSHELFNTYLKFLSEKYRLLTELEKFKRKYLHSGWYTDKGLQEKKVDSDYENLIKGYDDVSGLFLKDFYIIEEVSEIETKILEELRKDFEDKNQTVST